MLHARSRDGIRKDGKISGLGAGAEAEGLNCRARRSRLDRLVGQPRRRGLSNLWYGVQLPAWLVCPVSSGLAGARDVGLDPGHAEGRRPVPGATLHMSQNGVWPIGMPRRASARVPHKVKQSPIFGSATVSHQTRRGWWRFGFRGSGLVVKLSLHLWAITARRGPLRLATAPALSWR
jgi:hypothetical protein